MVYLQSNVIISGHSCAYSHIMFPGHKRTQMCMHISIHVCISSIHMTIYLTPNKDQTIIYNNLPQDIRIIHMVYFSMAVMNSIQNNKNHNNSQVLTNFLSYDTSPNAIKWTYPELKPNWSYNAITFSTIFLKLDWRQGKSCLAHSHLEMASSKEGKPQAP